MIDGNRVYPVKYLVLHHSMGPAFANTSDITVQDWFSDVGKSRAYQGGAINPSHEHPGRPGQLTYAQAQYAGIIDSSNKYNYRIITLINSPLANVAWHAGNWEINQQSIGIECCGDYTGQYLEDRQLMCIADEFRGVDQELISAGYSDGLQVLCHRDVYATACPGLIYEQRDKLVDMINNPNKWNAILFPATTPVTIPQPSTDIPEQQIPVTTPEIKVDDTTLV